MHILLVSQLKDQIQLNVFASSKVKRTKRTARKAERRDRKLKRRRTLNKLLSSK